MRHSARVVASALGPVPGVRATLVSIRGWLLACGLFLACGAAWSLDLDVLCDFEIEPQKLATALVEFSRQANTPVVSDTAEVDRFNSVGISGRMTLKDALQALLAGTRLDYKVTDKGVIAVGVFVRGRSGHMRAIDFNNKIIM